VNIRIEARGLKKAFSRRVIFQSISFVLTQGQTLLVTGKNGSGKSTLVKILSSVLTPTAGTVEITSDSAGGDHSPLAHIGLVSPYLMMYDEFSAQENLSFALAIRGMSPREAEIDALLKKVSLYERRHELVRTYSSGMKQRLKYAFALVHRPAILLLDEPMANLDDEGTAIVRRIMEEQCNHGILIVATNNSNDVDRYDLHADLNERL
jgi:heme exporter protein A